MAYFKNIKRIPRKLKKAAKKHAGPGSIYLSPGQLLWCYMEKKSPLLKKHIIESIIQTQKTK